MVESRPMQLANTEAKPVNALDTIPVHYIPKTPGMTGMPMSERCVPEFEIQAATLDNQIEELHQFVEALANKLRPVLKPPMPPIADAKGAVPPDAPVAPIAEYLRSKNRSMRQALDSLYLLNERIDL